MNKYESLWQQWIAAIEKTKLANTEYYNLAEGIKEADIKSAELRMEQPYPPDIIAFYSAHNVENGPAVASAFCFVVNGYGYDLLPFKQIAGAYNSLLHMESLFSDEDCEQTYEGVVISDKISVTSFTNPQWIPFAISDQGDYLLYDTDPSDKGTYGQIIELQNDSWQRNLIANSLEELVIIQIRAIEVDAEKALPLDLLEMNADQLLVQDSPIKNIVYADISFEIISRRDADKILNKLKDLKNENQVFYVFDTAIFPEYDGNGVFLLCHEDASAEYFELNNEVDKLAGIKILGYIFLKNLKIEKSLLTTNKQHTPSLIVMKDLECTEIKLEGVAKHYIADSIVGVDVIWCKGLGRLYVGNCINANLLIVQDMFVEIRTVELISSLVHIGDMTTYTLRSYYNENKEMINDLFLVTDTHNLQDVVSQDCIVSIDGKYGLNETSTDENTNVNLIMQASCSIVSEEHDFELDNHNSKINKANSGFETLDRLLSSDSVYKAAEDEIYLYKVKADVAPDVVLLEYHNRKHGILLYTAKHLKENRLSGGYAIYNNARLKCSFENLSLAEINPLAKSVLHHFNKAVLFFTNNEEPQRIIFPNPFGSALPAENEVIKLQLHYGFSDEYAEFLKIQNGFVGHKFVDADDNEQYLVGSNVEVSTQDFRDLYAFKASSEYNDLEKNQESTIFESCFFVIGSDCAGNEFVEVKAGIHKGRIGCIDHELYASCDSIEQFFEEFDLGDYADMNEDERLDAILDEDLGLIAFHASGMAEFLKNCFLYSAEDGITIKELDQITEGRTG